MIALIDYGSGNIRSVTKALQHEGADVQPRQRSRPPRRRRCRRPAGRRRLRRLRPQSQVPQPLGAARATGCASGKPFLGICVGYQLLFDSSEESPGEPGFGFFPGQVKKFRSADLKIPQIGWNSLDLTQPAHPLWNSLPPEPYVFFVHSYFPVSERDDVVIARTTYGETFASGAALGKSPASSFTRKRARTWGSPCSGISCRVIDG